MNQNLNSIANAFIKTGSISVTSSLLPLNIEEASIVYIRLLYMLAHINEMPYFSNWLALISHINRTSYCDSMVGRKLFPNIFDSQKDETKQNCITNNGDEYRNYAKALLIFDNRRQIFKEMKKVYEKD